MTFRASTVGAAVLVMLLVSIGSVLAQDSAPEEKAAHPKADELLRRASEYLRGQSSFSVDAALTLEDKRAASGTGLSLNLTLALKRPNRFLITIAKQDEGPADMMFVCDGRRMYMYLPPENKYTMEDAPEDITTVLTDFGGGPLNVVLGWLAELLRETPFEMLLEEAGGAAYVGLEQAGKAKRHHIKLGTARYDADLWLDAGEKPLVTRSVLDISKLFRPTTVDQASPKLVGTFEFSNWVVDTNLPDDKFSFKPPEDAVEFEQPEPGRHRESEHPLKGKAAPDFTLDLLTGGKLNLGELKGKNVIVLDFWATWCGPCRVAMPILVEVTNEYKDKGVVFFAVNVRESAEAVKAFMAALNLNFNVALDIEGTVGGLYKIQALPTSVIIGKDGTIKVVHEGISPDFRDEVRSELGKLTAP